jgi:ADP-heptose:LPS heptosyltransferase
VPTLGLFGSTSPAWTAPRGARAAALPVEGFACSPCYLRRCPQATYCLDTLDAGAVRERARAWASAPRAEGAAGPRPAGGGAGG